MIEIMEGTKTPLANIGKAAGTCWGAPTHNPAANIKRAKECIMAGHGRTEEYPDLTMHISQYSARCIRELYTHIIGTTRLQESTRYVNCSDFKFFTSKDIKGENAEIYNNIMTQIASEYEKLIANGVSKEDAANILPLGMHTSIVLKINLRALQHLMNVRLCNRSYKEMRALAQEMKETVKNYSDEWGWIADNLFVPNCEANGYCTEKFCCGKALTKTKALEILKQYMSQNSK